MLYSVRVFDPFTMIAAGATLILVSFLASGVPAWRAAQLEPTEALREL
jgi:ABC-type lipoprotein release transport system permease subunit